MKKFIMLAAALALAAGATMTVKADTVTLVTSRPSGGDTVDWGQLGTPGTPVSNPFTATSTDGVGITGMFATGTGEAIQQGAGWNGNFASGDNLLWTTGSGPLTLDFNQGLSQVGAQIEADFFGGFTAQICDNLGDCFTEGGNSAPTGDNSAIYLGLNDLTGPDITSITFSLLTCTSSCGDFAINDLSLNGNGTSTTPEPGSLLLLGTGLIGLAGAVRRKFSPAL